MLQRLFLNLLGTIGQLGIGLRHLGVELVSLYPLQCAARMTVMGVDRLEGRGQVLVGVIPRLLLAVGNRYLGRYDWHSRLEPDTARGFLVAQQVVTRAIPIFLRDDEDP